MREAFAVPAEGNDLFRNFVLPVPFNELKYVQAIEFRPGNGKVVHHARILLDETGDLRQRDLDDPGPGFEGMDAQGAHFPEGHFLGWAPGRCRAAKKSPGRWREDRPDRPGASETDRPARDRQASIGLYFTNKAPAIHPALLRFGSKTIDIPPGESRYVVTDSYTLPVHGQGPQHLPARALSGARDDRHRGNAGRRNERLLRISDWDFNWQDEYEYIEPVDLPKGATLVMRYVYDNSAANPRNPSTPPRRVVTGPDGNDEMGELLIQLLAANAADAALLGAERRARRFSGRRRGREAFSRRARRLLEYGIRWACTTCSSGGTMMPGRSFSRCWNSRLTMPSRTTTSD